MREPIDRGKLDKMRVLETSMAFGSLRRPREVLASRDQSPISANGWTALHYEEAHYSNNSLAVADHSEGVSMLCTRFQEYT
jgi:hypothetical protein